MRLEHSDYRGGHAALYHQLEKKLQQIEKHNSVFTIDASQVESIDLHGFQALMWFDQHLRKMDIKLELLLSKKLVSQVRMLDLFSAHSIKSA